MLPMTAHDMSRKLVLREEPVVGQQLGPFAEELFQKLLA